MGMMETTESEREDDADINPFAPGTVNINKLMEEINRCPKKPSLKNLTDGSYHRMCDENYDVLKKVSQHHLESFNFMLDEGFPLALKQIKPLEMKMPNGSVVTIMVIDASLAHPRVPKECVTKEPAMYPSECRMKGTTYKGKLNLTFKILKDGKLAETFEDSVGEIPVMVKSKVCNLSKLNQRQQVAKKEDADDIGGYFIVNGKERVIRLLSAERRNFPIGISRSSWKDAGQLFSEFGVSMRCIRKDQGGSNMVLHYLNNGTARLRVFYDRQPIFFPLGLILKGLVQCSDNEIFQRMTQGKEDDSYYSSCCVSMLQLIKDEGLNTKADVRIYIGSVFRAKFKLPDWWSNEKVAEDLFDTSVAPHLTEDEEKFNLLVVMMRKLFAIAKGKAMLESPDNPMLHETAPSGHIYFNLLSDRIQMYLESIKMVMEKKIRGSKNDIGELSMAQIKTTIVSKYGTIVHPVTTLISTGNLMSKSGCGLKQTAGISVMAEKINAWRFMSHFRAVHRGSFFEAMRTTACRKLYPEAWGFLCPVHTPDGSPCGLLNHLAEMCFIAGGQPSTKGIPSVLISLGMHPVNSPNLFKCQNQLDVMLDGKLIGFVSADEAKDISFQLRAMKARNSSVIPNTLEIGYIPPSPKATQFPGIYMFSNPSRMLRPVMNLTTRTVELIGSFEQPYLEICIIGDEAHETTTHQEIRETSMLSLLATQIPFPDFNQSPRNMYSCQMTKQTMGTPSHTLKYRSDQKMYEIYNAQSPLVRPAIHDHYHMDDYPMGSSAVVAVISYTGYDMEDALILNKASVERGFKHGSITKTEIIDLKKIDDKRGSGVPYYFGRNKDDPKDAMLDDFLDEDGLPIIGKELNQGDPMCSYIEIATGRMNKKSYKTNETARVLDVKILGSDTGTEPMTAIAIRLFIRRIPAIGDKFANRHGQKGVCSFLWPQESMPFTESGMTPDILFNPHGYPSRMTIGMMIESMAGKTASTLGTVHDCTPFTFSEDNHASTYYGDLLEEAGFNYHGTEKMYSGVDGRILKADIFIGVLYYIRLRHMVGDKYQVRSTGPIDGVTHQPVKGRKRMGGIRFGEMERDSLLSHGTSFLLHDRLFNCSDQASAHACSKCGSLISTFFVPPELELANRKRRDIFSCKICETSQFIKHVSVPYVLKYLVAELASCNIKLKFKIK